MRVLDGGCQCGRVRYRVEGEPIGLAVCHCRECQRQSGSAFGMSLALRRDAFQLVAGELASFTTVADSGRSKRCHFCPSCGTRIFHQSFEAAISLKAGTLDDTSWLVPTAHYWTQRMQPWVEIRKAFPGSATTGRNRQPRGSSLRRRERAVELRGCHESTARPGMKGRSVVPMSRPCCVSSVVSWPRWCVWWLKRWATRIQLGSVRVRSSTLLV